MLRRLLDHWDPKDMWHLLFQIRLPVMKGEVLTIQGNANLTAILWLELLTIYLHSRAMSKQYVMAHNPALPSTVTLLAFRPIASPARGEESSVVP